MTKTNTLSAFIRVHPRFWFSAEEPAQLLEHSKPLQPLDRVRRRDPARTNIAAVAERVTAKCAVLARDDFEPLRAATITRVDHERERAVQRHRPDVTRVQRHQRAS